MTRSSVAVLGNVTPSTVRIGLDSIDYELFEGDKVDGRVEVTVVAILERCYCPAATALSSPSQVTEALARCAEGWMYPHA